MGNIAQFSDQLRNRLPPTAAMNSQRPWLSAFADFQEIDVSLDETDSILWKRMKHPNHGSASFRLASELLKLFTEAREGYKQDVEAGRKPVKYMVLSSSLPDIFSLGGDLPFFMEKIQHQDRASLSLYAYQCIDVVHNYVNGLGFPVHTISLVQGDTLGGGFEAAMATDTIIAEKRAKFGLPEILFNLFPGMGAYSLIARKLDVVRAERMILSGKIYTADEMLEMGLIDVVAEDGQGEAALYDYIERHERQYTARQSIMRARQIARPVAREELKGIVDVWVEAAMSLRPQDLRRMQMIISAQNKRLVAEGHGRSAETIRQLATEQLTA